MFLINLDFLDKKYINCDVVLYTCVIIYTLNYRSFMAFLKNMFFEKPEMFEKHKIYESQYKKGSLYWGLGIENEVYLEFEKKTMISKRDFLTKHREERYSVNYFSNYKQDVLKKVMNQFVSDVSNDEIELPILLKSHSFSKTDIRNEPQTTYSKQSKPNPNFSGKTFLEELKDIDPYFQESYDVKWMFDGDVIEFPTRRFYKVSLGEVLDELSSVKKEFIEHLNNACDKGKIFQEYGPIKIMEKNYPFAKYMTNMKNLAMFNNGTLHYNLTLPTILDKNGKIKNRAKFIKDHFKAIRAIQWVEPFLIGIYGSGDPFSKISPELFSSASQRCAISRYIGLGTYDTDKMKCGKILARFLDEIDQSKNENWWFHQYYKENGYAKLDEIGMDINFNKHYNHGIEIRFLDHLSEDKDIAESFEFLIYLMDFSLESDRILDFGNPGFHKLWNGFLLNVMKHGIKYVLSDEESKFYSEMFFMEKPFLSNGLKDVFDGIFSNLIRKFTEIDQDFSIRYVGDFSKYVLKNESNYNKEANLVKSALNCCPF
jgi:hypothetical protein